MLLGLVPAVIVFTALTLLLLALVAVAPALATWLTPLPGAWTDDARTLLRMVVALAIIVGAVALAVVLFTAITLAIGAPIYERISRAVEDSHGGIAREVRRPLSQQVIEGFSNALRMLVTAAALGLAVAVIGLVPVVGTIAAAIVAAAGGARIVAGELVATPCDARGLTIGERRLLLRRNRWRVLGFGLSCYLVFLVPGGAIILTPAAVAGATLLTRDLLGERT
jgi:CysZ protein